MPFTSRPTINRINDRARDWMRRGGVEAVIATSPVNVYYLTGYHLWLDEYFLNFMVAPGAPAERLPTYAVVAGNEERSLIFNGAIVPNTLDLSIQHVVGYGGGKPTPVPSGFESLKRDDAEMQRYPVLTAEQPTAAEALAHALNETGLSEATLGLEVEGLSDAHLASIRAALPKAQLKDCSNLMRMIRMVKAADEIDALRCAAEISERACAEAMKLARPGVKVQDVITRYAEHIAPDNATFEHFCFSVAGTGMATESNYHLTDRDVLMIDWGCFYQHYFSDTGNTLMLGEPDAPTMHFYEAVRDALTAGQARMQPGVKASAVRAAMVESLEKAGAPVEHPHGHGLGLEIRDYPIVVSDNGLRITDDCIDVPSDVPFETDMVVNLECNIHLAAHGSWHCEQTFLVTDHGAELLTPQSRDAPIINA